MTKRVQTPDGNIAEFPDSMSDQEIQGVLRKKYPPQSNLSSVLPKQPTQETFLSESGKQLRSAGRGLRDLLALSSGTPAENPSPLGTLATGVSNTVGGILRELSGAPQSGQSVLSAPKDATDRLAGALDIAIGGDPSAARMHSLQGQTGAAAADLFTVPVSTALLGGLLRRVPVVGGDEAEAKQLTRASGGGGTKVDFPKQFEQALPAMRKAAGQVPVYGQVLDVAGLAQDVQKAFGNLENDFNTRLQPIAGNQVVPLGISQRILAKITPNMAQTADGRAIANYLRAKAVEYQKPWSLQELNLQRIAATKANRGLHTASPSSAGAQLKLDASKMVNQAVEEGAKDIVYGALEQRYAGQVPKGYFSNLKKTESALYDIQDQLSGRVNELSNARAKSPLDRGHAYASSGGHVGFAGNVREILDPEYRRADRQARKGMRKPTSIVAPLGTAAAVTGRRSQPSLSPDDEQ